MSLQDCVFYIWKKVTSMKSKKIIGYINKIQIMTIPVDLSVLIKEISQVPTARWRTTGN